MIKTRALIFFLIKEYLLIFNSKLTVHNYLDGPCYRCIYPKAPAPEAVSNSSDAGIMGPVVGCIGSMQALDAIKILTHTSSSLSGRMFIYDGLDFQTRPRQVHACEMCKKNVTVLWTWAHRYSDNYRERYRCNGRYLEPYRDDDNDRDRAVTKVTFALDLAPKTIN